MLRSGAVDTPGVPATLEGQGTLCLVCSIGRFPTQTSQQVTATTGGGLFDDARGRLYLVDDNGIALQGQKDIFGNPVDTVNLAWREAVDEKTGKYVNNSSPWTTRADGTETWFNGSFPLGTRFCRRSGARFGLAKRQVACHLQHEDGLDAAGVGRRKSDA